MYGYGGYDLYGDCDDGYGLIRGDGSLNYKRLNEKSEKAQASENEAKAAFRAHMKASTELAELTTTRLLQPSQHLTQLCWRDFSKYVKTFAGWTAKRVVAFSGSGKGAGKKTYCVDVTFRPSPKTPKAPKTPKQPTAAAAKMTMEQQKKKHKQPDQPSGVGAAKKAKLLQEATAAVLADKI